MTIRTPLRSSKGTIWFKRGSGGRGKSPRSSEARVRRAINMLEEVLDDLEVLTKIDSSGSDYEPLVRPSSGRNVMPRKCVAEGSQGGDRRTAFEGGSSRRT